MEVTLCLETNSKIEATLKVRMQYNAILKILQMNASPLLTLAVCPDIFVIKEICGCLPK